MGNLTTDCIAYWGFDEYRTKGILDDLAKSHELTQYNNPQVITGRNGFGRSIRSSNEVYLTTPDTADLSLTNHTGSNHELSIAVWVKWDRFPTLTDHSTNQPGIFAGSVTKMRLDTTSSEEYRLMWELSDRGDLEAYMQVFDTASNQHAISARGYSRSSTQRGPGRDGVPRIATRGNLLPAASMEIDTWYLLIGTWKRVSAAYGKAYVHIYQGKHLDGSEPNVIWRARDGSMFPTSRSKRSRQRPVSGDWLDTFDSTGTFGIGRWWSGEEYYQDFDIDSLGIWDYELTIQDRHEIWNNGFGADFPFLDTGSDMYAPIPGPVIYPVPHSLYQGFSWNPGETPVPPAPNGWWSVQPTLPAWHIPPRIQGWAYDNPFPRPAPLPLVSQWRLQASEPVDDRDERSARIIASLAPPITSISSETPAVITPPPPPPAPPLDNSEAVVSDDGYRPGRPDPGTDGYERP